MNPVDLEYGRIDDDVLALLYLTSFRDGEAGPWRAPKQFDADALSRLCEKGYISDPAAIQASIAFTEDGFEKAKELFEARYTKHGEGVPL